MEKVSLWRLLSSGFTLDGVHVKLNMQRAAQKLEISKKSLDDYLMQLRFAKKYGFDFAKHANSKIGVLRKFVREKKDMVRRQLLREANQPVDV